MTVCARHMPGLHKLQVVQANNRTKIISAEKFCALQYFVHWFKHFPHAHCTTPRHEANTRTYICLTLWPIFYSIPQPIFHVYSLFLLISPVRPYLLHNIAYDTHSQCENLFLFIIIQLRSQETNIQVYNNHRN